MTGYFLITQALDEAVLIALMAALYVSGSVILAGYLGGRKWRK